VSAVQSVAQALLDSAEGLTSAEVIEETGEPAGAVYVALNMLRSNGYVVRDGEKRQTVADQAALQAIAKGERPAKPNGSRHAAPSEHQASEEEPAPRRKYKKRKARATPRKQRHQVKPRKQVKRRKMAHRKATPPQDDAPRLIFSLAETGDVRIDRADGQGTCTFIPRADALRLLGALESWRVVLEASA
jgi:hypothetical protein